MSEQVKYTNKIGNTTVIIESVIMVRIEGERVDDDLYKNPKDEGVVIDLLNFRKENQIYKYPNTPMTSGPGQYLGFFDPVFFTDFVLWCERKEKALKK